jgi:hypothetical protein
LIWKLSGEYSPLKATWRNKSKIPLWFTEDMWNWEFEKYKATQNALWYFSVTNHCIPCKLFYNGWVGYLRYDPHSLLDTWNSQMSDQNWMSSRRLIWVLEGGSRFWLTSAYVCVHVWDKTTIL